MASQCHRLPMELLLQVFSLLCNVDAPPISASKFLDEPDLSLVRQKDCPLKTLSRVCKSWRQILLPWLFKYSCVRLSSEPRWLALNSGDELLRLLDVIRQPGRSDHEEHIAQRLEEATKHLQSATDSDNLPDPVIFEFIEDSDRILPGTASPPVCHWRWIPSLKGPLEQYFAFMKANELQNHVKSFALSTDASLELSKVSDLEREMIIHEVRQLWEEVFRSLGGSGGVDRVLVAAPPCTIGVLCNSYESVADTWAFDMPLHLVEFSLDASTDTSRRWQASANESLRPEPVSSNSSWFPILGHHEFCLPNAQPWTHLRYNEGTSLSVYSTYEFQWKKTPRVLSHIMQWLVEIAKCSWYVCGQSPGPIALKSMTYVSLFPLSTHVQDIIWSVEELSRISPLTEFIISLGDSDHLNNPQRLGKGLAVDCWAEWLNSYRKLREFLERAKQGFTIVSLDGKSTNLSKLLNEGFVRFTSRSNYVEQDGHELVFRKQ